MDLASFLQKLENNLKSAICSTETDKMNFYHLCNTLTLKFLSSHKVNYVEKLQGLVVAFIVYGKMRNQQLTRKNLIIAMNYLTNLAVETGRLVLSYEYTTLNNDSPTKAALLSTVLQLQKTLESIYDEWKLLNSLQHLIISGWNHEMLIKLINGDPVSDEEGLDYLKKEEHPRLLRLRLDLLMSHNCPEYASNFLLWLLKCEETKDDPYLMYLRLSHLCITGQLEEFYRKCMELSCVTACKVMTNSLIHPHHCFSTSCTSLLLARVLVNMTVIQDEYFCNKDIMKFWVKTEHLYSKGNHKIFMKNINEYAKTVKEPKFIVNLVEILHQEYQKQYTSLCTSMVMRALIISRHAYDKARLYLPETFSNQSALRCMLALLHLLEKLYCDNMLIRVYCQLSNLTLMPCDAIYFAVEKTCMELQTRYNIKNSVESFNLVNAQLVAAFIKTPVEKTLYTLLKNYVDRFDHKKPWLWNESMKSSMLSLMSEAGWIFDPVLKRFRRTRVPAALMVAGSVNTGYNNSCNSGISNINGAGGGGGGGIIGDPNDSRRRSINGVRNNYGRKVKNRRRVFKETDLTYNPSKSMTRRKRKGGRRTSSRGVNKKRRRFKMVDESDDEDDDGDGYGRTTSRTAKNHGNGGHGNDDSKDFTDKDDMSDTDIDEKTDSDMNDTELDEIKEEVEKEGYPESGGCAINIGGTVGTTTTTATVIKTEPIFEEKKMEIGSSSVSSSNVTTHAMVLRNGKMSVINVPNGGDSHAEKRESSVKNGENLKPPLSSSPRVHLTRIHNNNNNNNNNNEDQTNNTNNNDNNDNNCSNNNNNNNNINNSNDNINDHNQSKSVDFSCANKSEEIPETIITKNINSDSTNHSDNNCNNNNNNNNNNNSNGNNNNNNHGGNGYSNIINSNNNDNNNKCSVNVNDGTILEPSTKVPNTVPSE